MNGLSAENSKAGRLQRACLDLARKHEADGAIPTNGRFLFYELSQAGIIPKHYVDATGRKKPRQPSADISDALTHLRETGLVPWSWIIDELRHLDEWEFAPSVYEYVAAAAEYARLDLWGGKPAPLLICESGAVAGVLRNLAAEYLTPITATKGQCKGHLVTKVAPLLVDDDRHVGYIGDHELRGPGEQIEAHTRRAIEEHAGRQFDSATWQRIALTQEQVDADRRLAAEVIVKADNRYKPAKHYKAVECEAIKQTVLVKLVRAWLDARLPEPIERVHERERQQRQRMAAALAELEP
jgi:hypothetical protein